MDTQRDSDLLEQHNTSQTEVAMPDLAVQRSSQETTFEGPETPASTDVVPGPPAVQPESEQPTLGSAHCGPAFAPGTPVQQAPPASCAREPGSPVARTGFQASLRPYSSGKGVPLSMHPEAQTTSQPESQVPEVGQEIAMLGPEAGELLRKRRVAE
eukprot:4447565-Amphidinium_carterae.1